ncbi:MAG: ABC transporter substrate-binding protein [Clostridiales bacterium]|jgi:NitT/TauT family transport system substrate-binding protein|nr:ABC transporter substrate-binding protein [Clostridiales bacterium]
MKKLIGLTLAALLTFSIASCGAKTEQAGTAQDTSESATSSAESDSGVVEIIGAADLVPHSELINFVSPKLLEQGVKVTLATTATDSTTNEKTNAGEFDFNFFQHEPYLLSENETNGFDLENVGDIHVEPITAYSDKYASKSEIKSGDTVAIPNDGTNEYRALRILEQDGFIKLNAETANSLSASVADIAQNTKNLEIIELDSAQIIPTKDDYDFFITNTNKALEAKITSARLFSEGGDSPYANIIAVNLSNLSAEKQEAIKKLVVELQSEDTRKYIEDTYFGAVIPAAQGSSNTASGNTDSTVVSVIYPSAVDPTSITEFKYGKVQIPGKGGALCGAPVYIAYEKGFFAAEGFDVELISADTETRKIGLNNGTIPVVNGDFQFFQSIENGVNVSVVEGLHKGCIKFLVKADSAIQSVADVKGKVMAIDEVGGTPHQVAAVWLEKAGISADQADKEVTFLPFEEGNLEIEALRSGDVDIAALWDPFASIQAKTGEFREVFDLATDPLFAEHYCCYLYASNKWIEEKPEQVAALLRAYRAAQDWIANNIDEAVNIIADKKYSEIDDQKEIAIELLEHYQIPHIADHGTASYDVGNDVKYFAEQLYDIGYLETTPEEFVKLAYYNSDLTLGQ